MYRRTPLTFAIIVAAAAIAAGCRAGSLPVAPQYVSACVDRASMLRMPDAYCQNGSHPADSWGYFGPGQTIPSVNQRVIISQKTTNIFVVPTSNGKPAPVQRGGAPSTGEVVKRGGLGVPATTSSRAATPAPRSSTVPTTSKRFIGSVPSIRRK